ncbi:MAG: hypothetical protein ACMVO3_10260 [Thalassobaculum sp.]
MTTIVEAARALPGDRLDEPASPTPSPRARPETFLVTVRQQVYARAHDPRSPYGLECETRPPVDGLQAAARSLEAALRRLVEPMLALRKAAARHDGRAGRGHRHADPAAGSRPSRAP